jgi:hypothetical protein
MGPIPQKYRSQCLKRLPEKPFSLLDKEPLTRRRERSTPVPMILLAIALLELRMSLNRALSTTSLIFPWVALGERIWLRARCVFVEVVHVASVMGGWAKLAKRPRSGVVWVHGIEKPLGVALALVGLVHKGAILRWTFMGALNVMQESGLGKKLVQI